MLVVIWYGLADDPAVSAEQLAGADSNHNDGGVVDGGRASEGQEARSSGSGSHVGQEKQGASMVQRNVEA